MPGIQCISSGSAKGSGIGRELGPEALDEFFELKAIYGSAALLDGSKASRG